METQHNDHYQTLGKDHKNISVHVRCAECGRKDVVQVGYFEEFEWKCRCGEVIAVRYPDPDHPLPQGERG